MAVRTPLWESLAEDVIIRFKENDVILIGKTMARKLNLSEGDSLTLLAPKGKTTAFGTLPSRQSFKIGKKY